MDGMPRRALGSSGITVSVLSLGSWMTFEHLPREQGVEVMVAARDQGIDFLDDARYDDHTGTAPIPTGWSEVVFGELFRAAGWRRDEVTVANKLWLEHWPHESAAQELDGSLSRMGFEHLDLVYCAPPPVGLAVDELVGAIGELINAGKVRAWGVLNWPAATVADAARVARTHGVPLPCAAQLPYNLVHRSAVEDAAVVDVFRDAGISAVASAVLAGGALTGKYASAAPGRLARQLDAPLVRPALEAGARLEQLAATVGATPAALAFAFALANPIVASAVFGATTPAQVVENCRAPAVLDALTPDRLAELREIR